jgi:hypothetical protein
VAFDVRSSKVLYLLEHRIKVCRGFPCAKVCRGFPCANILAHSVERLQGRVNVLEAFILRESRTSVSSSAPRLAGGKLPSGRATIC